MIEKRGEGGRKQERESEEEGKEGERDREKQGEGVALYPGLPMLHETLKNMGRPGYEAREGV